MSTKNKQAGRKGKEKNGKEKEMGTKIVFKQLLIKKRWLGK